VFETGQMAARLAASAPSRSTTKTGFIEERRADEAGGHDLHAVDDDTWRKPGRGSYALPIAPPLGEIEDVQNPPS
jgi:hypothetical protein